MAKRKIFSVLVIVAILGAVVAVTARSSRAEAAVDDCLSKPNAPPPQGSHWYYRSDRASNRRCWYLGPQGEKISQAASPSTAAGWKPAPQPVEPPVEAIVGANEAMPAAPVPWLGLPTSIAAVERKPALTSDSDADEPSETRPREDMPLIWPVLTAADLGATEASTVKADRYARAGRGCAGARRHPRSQDFQAVHRSPASASAIGASRSMGWRCERVRRPRASRAGVRSHAGARPSQPARRPTPGRARTPAGDAPQPEPRFRRSRDRGSRYRRKFAAAAARLATRGGMNASRARPPAGLRIAAGWLSLGSLLRPAINAPSGPVASHSPGCDGWLRRRSSGAIGSGCRRP